MPVNTGRRAAGLIAAVVLCASLIGCSRGNELARGRIPVPESSQPAGAVSQPAGAVSQPEGAVSQPPTAASQPPTAVSQPSALPESTQPGGTLVSAASEKSGVTDKEVVIGSCCALDGPAKFLGTQLVVGARAYISYINDQGGVNGRKIRLITHSDGYEPARAIACFNQLLKENVFAAAFFVGSPTAAKYVPMAEANNVPLVGLFSGAQLLHEPFRPHVMSVRASYFDETMAQVDHLWKDLGLRKVAVIYQDDAFGAAVLNGVKRALAKYQAVPVALGAFPRNTLKVEEAIKQVREASPEAVVLVGSYAPLAEIVKRGHESGWKPLFTTVSFVGTEAYIKAAGKDAEGTLITQVVPPYNRDDLPTVVLYKKILKKYAPSAEPNFVSLEGFVDAMVVVEGLKRAGRDLTRSKFICALESIHDHDMGLGPVLKLNYGPNRHKGFDSVYYTVVRHGYPVTLSNWKELIN